MKLYCYIYCVCRYETISNSTNRCAFFNLSEITNQILYLNTSIFQIHNSNNNAPSRNLCMCNDCVFTCTILDNCKYVINKGYISYVAFYMKS